MVDETTTEQLAEIDRDMADIDRQVAELVEEAQQADYKTQELPTKTQELETKTQELPEYTPPEGWRVLAVGELLQPGDHWVSWEGTVSRPDIQHGDGATVSGGRYIRRIKPEPQPEAEPVQVREGRWRTRHGDIRNVTPTPAHDSRAKRWPWRDAKYDQTWREDGGHHIIGESPSDLVEYLGPIEPQPQPQPEAVPQPQLQPDGLVRDVTHLLQESGVLDLAKAEQQIEELRSEVSYVQNLLGESRRRVTHLESLVANLRTINAAQEKAVDAAGKENTALQRELAVAKEELTIAAAVSQQLQIELDAAQQVPADLPELRQLRSDLAEVAHDRDTYRHEHELLVQDANTAHERTKAMTVEAIVEWLQPFRGCNSPSLALLLLEALPHIMRSLTGLNPEESE
jgi:hypothetical protein